MDRGGGAAFVVTSSMRAVGSMILVFFVVMHVRFELLLIIGRVGCCIGMGIDELVVGIR